MYTTHAYKSVDGKFKMFGRRWVFQAEAQREQGNQQLETVNTKGNTLSEQEAQKKFADDPTAMAEYKAAVQRRESKKDMTIREQQELKDIQKDANDTYKLAKLALQAARLDGRPEMITSASNTMQKVTEELTRVKEGNISIDEARVINDSLYMMRGDLEQYDNRTINQQELKDIQKNANKIHKFAQQALQAARLDGRPEMITSASQLMQETEAILTRLKEGNLSRNEAGEPYNAYMGLNGRLYEIKSLIKQSWPGIVPRRGYTN